MRFDAEKEMEDILFRHWFEARKDGLLDAVLPSARVWQRRTEAGRLVGYETREHTCLRQVPLPGTGPNKGVGYADIIETYLSVIVDEDRSDWGPNLHINVVELKNEMLRVPHLEQLTRYVVAVDASFRAARVTDAMWPRLKTHRDGWPRHSVYLRGALIGPAVSPELVSAVSLTSALLMNSVDELPIKVGIFGMHPTRGLLVEDVDEYGERFPLGMCLTSGDAGILQTLLSGAEQSQAIVSSLDWRRRMAREGQGGSG